LSYLLIFKDGIMQISQALILKNFDISIDSFVIKKSYFNTINFQFDILSNPNGNEMSCASDLGEIISNKIENL